MARGVIAFPPGPPTVRTYKVTEGNRIRISREDLEGLVPWLSGETVERVAVLGPRGGITVTSPEAVTEALTRLGPDDLGEESAGTRRGDYARFLGMRWPLAFTFESQGKGNRYTITLPEGARRLGLLPGPEGEVVVFISGSIFEIWDKDQWLTNVKAQGLTVGQILEGLE
jgi:hypothetical protein